MWFPDKMIITCREDFFAAREKAFPAGAHFYFCAKRHFYGNELSSGLAKHLR